MRIVVSAVEYAAVARPRRVSMVGMATMADEEKGRTPVARGKRWTTQMVTTSFRSHRNDHHGLRLRDSSANQPMQAQAPTQFLKFCLSIFVTYVFRRVDIF